MLLWSHGSFVVIVGVACRTFEDREEMLVGMFDGIILFCRTFIHRENFFGAIRDEEVCVGEVMGAVDESECVVEVEVGE